MRNGSDQQGGNVRQWRKKKQKKIIVSTCDISSMKHVTRKFQRRQRNVEESMLHVQSVAVAVALYDFWYEILNAIKFSLGDQFLHSMVVYSR